MLKNIVLGVVLTSISAGLVYGAVTRTELRATTAVVGNNGSNAGRTALNSESNERSGRNQNLSDLSNEGNSGNGNRANSGNSQSDSAARVGEPLELALAEVDEIFQYEGIVEVVNADYLLVDAYDGSQILIENRAWWYAVEAGFSASAGDEVILIGFYDGDVFETMSIENKTQGTAVQVREDSGRPLWAGNGSNGNGSGNRQ